MALFGSFSGVGAVSVDKDEETNQKRSVYQRYKFDEIGSFSWQP